MKGRVFLSAQNITCHVVKISLLNKVTLFMHKIGLFK